jgi:PmbA protein
LIDRIIRSLPRKYRWFDMIRTESVNSSLSYKNNRLYSLSEKQSGGFGIRVNTEERTGFSYTNDEEGIEEAVKRAVSLAAYGDIEAFDLPEPLREIPFEPFDKNIEKFSVFGEIIKAESIMAAVRERYPEASVDVSIGKSWGQSRLLNSCGFDASYRNSYYSISASATVVQRDGTKIDVWEQASALAPCSGDHIPRRLIELISQAQTVRKAGSGIMPVIFTPRAFSRLLGLVLAGLDAKSVHKGISPYTGRLNDRMFSDRLTVLDDPSLGDSPFSYPFDDEGVQAQRKFLIKNGTVENYITDLRFAAKLGIRPGGNASRGYASLPHPSFSNIAVEAGSSSFQDLMKGFGRGILVDQFIGLGQSNTITGDFSANLDLAFLFEKGEIIGRVKDCMISDNIFTMLEGVFMLSAEREQNGSIVLPHAAFPAVNYSG